MSPKDFIQARGKMGANHVLVHGKPYLPNLHVSPNGPSHEVAAAVLSILGLPTSNGTSWKEVLTVVPVPGGLSNTLFRVQGLQTCWKNNPAVRVDSLLVRIFGAEGMIDRDVETSTFAVLAREGHAPPYYGRFANGRVEGWMDGMVALSAQEVSSNDTICAIARKVAVLHTQFHIPDELKEYHSEPSMWQQMEEWLQQALANKYQTTHDEERAASLQLDTTVAAEFAWIRSNAFPADAMVVYCHNDLLGANILYNPETQALQLIDFEYGGVNYRSFDLANHWNEYAGGPPDEAVPNYDLLPNEEQRTLFCRTYLEAAAASGNNNISTSVTEEQIRALRSEVQAFLLPNHLYWGLWGFNQAASEGCEKYDYMRYGMERFRQYYKCKEEWVSSSP